MLVISVREPGFEPSMEIVAQPSGLKAALQSSVTGLIRTEGPGRYDLRRDDNALTVIRDGRDLAVFEIRRTDETGKA